MSRRDHRDLARRRLTRARETLEEARLMTETEHWKAAVNRLYYACFYAVGALLASRHFAAKTHTGARSLLSQHFVKTGTLSKKLAAFYNDLFDYRLECDYDDFAEIDPVAIRTWLPRAEEFIDAIAGLIDNVA